MLGIVIVNYRDYDRTERFIREELSRIRRPYRVVVADNGGDPARAEALRVRTGCQVIVRENDGYASGCNAGAAALFADPDGKAGRFERDRIPHPKGQWPLPHPL